MAKMGGYLDNPTQNENYKTQVALQLYLLQTMIDKGFATVKDPSFEGDTKAMIEFINHTNGALESLKSWGNQVETNFSYRDRNMFAMMCAFMQDLIDKGLVDVKNQENPRSPRDWLKKVTKPDTTRNFWKNTCARTADDNIRVGKKLKNCLFAW